VKYKRKLWLPSEDQLLREIFADRPTKVVGSRLGRSLTSVIGHAKKLGLRKDEAYRARMKETQFRKGQHPHNWRRIGSTRISKDGYLQRKVTDTGYPPSDWVGEHILIWRTARGDVPIGHAVVFKDGDRTHIALDNLEMISRRELMARNTVHNLPGELKEVIHLKGLLNRQIRKREVGNGKEPERSAGAPVRHARTA